MNTGFKLPLSPCHRSHEGLSQSLYNHAQMQDNLTSRWEAAYFYFLPDFLAAQ